MSKFKLKLDSKKRSFVIQVSCLYKKIKEFTGMLHMIVELKNRIRQAWFNPKNAY
jgi:hypothetical protein